MPGISPFSYGYWTPIGSDPVEPAATPRDGKVTDVGKLSQSITNTHTVAVFGTSAAAASASATSGGVLLPFPDFYYTSLQTVTPEWGVDDGDGSGGTTHNRFTIGRPGWYDLAFNVTTSSSAIVLSLKQGADAIEQRTGVNTYSLRSLVRADAGDQFTIVAVGSTGSAQVLSGFVRRVAHAS